MKEVCVSHCYQYHTTLHHMSSGSWLGFIVGKGQNLGFTLVKINTNIQMQSSNYKMHLIHCCSVKTDLVDRMALPCKHWFVILSFTDGGCYSILSSFVCISDSAIPSHIRGAR